MQNLVQNNALRGGELRSSDAAGITNAPPGPAVRFHQLAKRVLITGRAKRAE
jgi:hypothetical protein